MHVQFYLNLKIKYLEIIKKDTNQLYYRRYKSNTNYMDIECQVEEILNILKISQMIY